MNNIEPQELGHRRQTRWDRWHFACISSTAIIGTYTSSTMLRQLASQNVYLPWQHQHLRSHLGQPEQSAHRIPLLGPSMLSSTPTLGQVAVSAGAESVSKPRTTPYSPRLAVQDIVRYALRISLSAPQFARSHALTHTTSTALIVSFLPHTHIGYNAHSAASTSTQETILKQWQDAPSSTRDGPRRQRHPRGTHPPGASPRGTRSVPLSSKQCTMSTGNCTVRRRRRQTQQP